MLFKEESAVACVEFRSLVEMSLTALDLQLLQTLPEIGNVSRTT